MSLPQLETPLKLLLCNALQCCLRFSFLFIISLNLHLFNHVSIYENQNKPWRPGWRSTEARYHHHLFLVRHRKKSWIRMAWRVVMTQKPVLCTKLVGHFLSTASKKSLSTPMQNCWFTGWQWRKKNSFWRIASLFKKTDNMLLKSDFLYLSSLGWQEGDSIHYDDCCFVPGS